MEKVHITIVGAGVIGLAIAAELSQKYQDVVLLEKETAFGQGTSSRNSEVIHAGIYYPKNSLKAKLCVEGNKLLYAFCKKYNIPHKRLGKLIVAVEEGEIDSLQKLEKQAKANGVNDLQWLNSQQVKELEPNIKSVAALLSPSTGIIDTHSLMKMLEKLAKDNGAMASYGSEVVGITKQTGGYLIKVKENVEILSKVVINSAGLNSDQIAAMAGIDIKKAGYQLHFCKGEYFSYSKPSFLKHLVYPVPAKDLTGLGIHTIIDLAGNLKFGPSAEYIDRIDYQVDHRHRQMFYEDISNLFSQVKLEDLAPDQAGVRPKLQGPGEVFRDFIISEETKRALPGLINLIGIESPGLTASLAIAKLVSSLI